MQLLAVEDKGKKEMCRRRMILMKVKRRHSGKYVGLRSVLPGERWKMNEGRQK